MWLIPDNNGYTPLHELVKLQRYQSVAWLIEYIAPVSSKRKFMHARIEACEATLLAYINFSSIHGTPLHTAISTVPVCVELAALLINSGAELYHLQDEKCRTVFDLILSLPPTTVMNLFRRLHRAHQEYFLAQYEKTLADSPASDKTLFIKLNSIISLFRTTRNLLLQSPAIKSLYIEKKMQFGLQDVQNDLPWYLPTYADELHDVQNHLVWYLPPYEHAIMKQHHLYFEDLAELNKMIDKLSNWITDLHSRPTESRLCRTAIFIGNTVGFLLFIGGFIGLMFTAGYIFEKNGINIGLFLAAFGCGLLCSLLSSSIPRSTRISSAEWKDLINTINVNILMPLQIMEVEDVNALPVAVENINELEVSLNNFQDRLIPTTLEITLDNAQSLQTTLSQMKRTMITTRRPFTLFQPPPLVEEVRIYLPSDEEHSNSDEEHSNDDEMMALLQPARQARANH